MNNNETEMKRFADLPLRCRVRTMLRPLRGRVANLSVVVPPGEDSAPMQGGSGGRSQRRSALGRLARRFSPYKNNAVPPAQPTLGLSGPMQGMDLSGPVSSRTRARRHGFRKPLPSNDAQDVRELDNLVQLFSSGPPSNRERPLSLAERTKEHEGRKAAEASQVAALAPVPEASSTTDSEPSRPGPTKVSAPGLTKVSASGLPFMEYCAAGGASSSASTSSTDYTFLLSSGYGFAPAESRVKLHPRAAARVKEIKEARTRAQQKLLSHRPPPEPVIHSTCAAGSRPPDLWLLSWALTCDFRSAHPEVLGIETRHRSNLGARSAAQVKSSQVKSSQVNAAPRPTGSSSGDGSSSRRRAPTLDTSRAMVRPRANSSSSDAGIAKVTSRATARSDRVLASTRRSSVAGMPTDRSGGAPSVRGLSASAPPTRRRMG